ncbi:MAG: TRAP transporter small permease [Alphaproteobacteria bacterium]
MDVLAVIITWARQRAENLLAALLAVMFCAFLLQIFTRYVTAAPLSWTSEVSTLAWFWGILCGAALVLRNDEEIRFDLIYSRMPDLIRRAFDFGASGTVSLVFAYSLPTMADYVFFMRVERSAYLGLRMDWAFSVYLIFAVAMIIRHAAIMLRALFPSLGGARA